MVVVAVTKKTSRLTISLENGSAARQRGIMLSESIPIKSENLKVMLEVKPVMDAWNISQDWLPENVHIVDGDNSCSEYLAYSFYLVNVGQEDVNLTFNIKIKGTKGLEDTVRIRIYLQDFEEEEPSLIKTYAKVSSDGNPEVGTLPFATNDTILNQIEDLKVHTWRRVSVIVWIEGEDLDTTNDKMGGTISLDAKFKIVE